ncbi:MAG: hypothetical protein HWN67_19950 [Candidatus Helarchaeota archaeon]|nr:hypothetical protein [Candidatus Helarchaeota archaeon]
MIKWDDKEGVLLESKYPEDLKIEQDEIMRIYTSHAMGEGRPGLLSIKLSGADNVLSYFTGIDVQTQYAIAILLDIDEDSNWFEDPLLESVNNIISNVGTEKFKGLLSKTFVYIVKSSKLTQEQIYAFILKDYKLNKLFEILKEGPLTIKDLKDRLEKELGETVSNLDNLLSHLIRGNLIIRDFIKEGKVENIFLIRDFYGTRLPPYNIISQVQSKKFSSVLANDFIQHLLEYFQLYTPSAKDIERLAEIITNPIYYDLISIMRKQPILSEDISKHSDFDEEEIEEVYQSLLRLNIIAEFKDHKLKNWTLLTSDIRFHTFFPSYLLENLRNLLRLRKIERPLAIKHFELLEKNYS